MRLEAELLPSVKAAAAQPTAAVTPRRPIARWVLLLGVVPLLLIGVVGASLINVVVHTERATGKIVQPPLQRGADGLEPQDTGAANARGGAAPLPTALPSLSRKEPFTFLLVGVDAREGDTQSQSDTVILVYIDPSEKSAHLLSIPRDRELHTLILPDCPPEDDTLGDSVRTDFQSDQWASLAKLGAEMRGNAITQFSLVSYITNSNTSAGFYSFVDWAKVGEYMKQFSPKENKDALRSQTQPGTNLNAKIVVENGTRNGGLANRWATTLGQQSYMRTSFIDAPTNVKGTVRTAKVYALHGDEQTARAIAQTLNLKPERVQTTTKRPPEAPSDLPGDTDILVVLGDDVLEPG